MKLSCGLLALCRSAALLASAAGIAPLARLDCAQERSAASGYQAPVRELTGTIRVCGSPQMAELLRHQESGFRLAQPQIRFEGSLDNTLAAVSCVATGHADLGLLGREIWQTELQEFTAVHGHPPLVLRIALGSYDVPKATFALMVFVPRTNPIAALSFDQLERIFADSPHAVHNWGELGLTGVWTQRPIHLYGFARTNDKARIFRSLVFKGNEPWSRTLTEFSNSSGPQNADAGALIIRAVAGDPDGIGISNIHYASAAVRALPLASLAGSPAVPPTRKAVAAGIYPLTRAIYLVADPAQLTREDEHTSARSPLVEFLHFVFSEQGRRAVVEEGNYLPLTPTMAHDEEMLIQRTTY